MSSGGCHGLELVAETGARFADFRPYVPAIGDDGTVTFTAALVGGGSGIFTGCGDGAATVALAEGRVARFCSHPDRSSQGIACAYAELSGGGTALAIAREGACELAAEARGTLAAIGPLGPTMNEVGDIAFRATLQGGAQAVLVHRRGTVIAVADTRMGLAGFEGLPVVSEAGAVVFRANLAKGGGGIYRYDGQRPAALVETGTVFAELGRFPCVLADERVAFAATMRSGGHGVFTVRAGGEPERLVDTSEAFVAVRGALVGGDRGTLFFATPHGGTLGIYAAMGTACRRVLGLGDGLLGSTVADFALNPVSINRHGQVAIRIELDGGAQCILRTLAEPR